jgi:hypothetical protein
MTYGAAALYDVQPTFLNLFFPTYIGAVLSMALFYFASDYFMDRAALKREVALKKAITSGVLVNKKKFTKLNKAMVWLKIKVGIYGITCIAPIFLSIPIGSIVCAKFYGNKKKTFPLMLVFTAAYAALMSEIIILING